MILKRIFIPILLLTSCAHPPRQTFDQIDALRDERMKVARHTFHHVSVKQLRNAFGTVFRLLDGNDVSFKVLPDRLLITRRWSYYAVLVIVRGKAYYEVKFAPNGDSVTAMTVGEYAAVGSPLGQSPDDAFRENMELSGDNNVGMSIGDYKLLYGRVAYILGQQNTWPDCKEYNKTQWEPMRRPANNITICDSFTKDLPPDRSEALSK